MNVNADYHASQEHTSEMPCARHPMRGAAEAYAMTALHHRLAEGSAVDLEKLQVTGGVLGVDGWQVVFYNPDQGEAIDRVLATGQSGTTFHLARCSALLEELEHSGSGRHVAVSGVSGHRLVYGASRVDGQMQRGMVRLQVCEHCLDSLNYKGYRTHKEQRVRIREQFDIAECFARFSTLFGRYPIAQKAVLNASAGHCGSALDQAPRADTCERCALALRSHQHLLTPADRNADQPDRRTEPWRALCLDCQRKEPVPSRLPVRGADMRLIQRCRRAQGLLDDIGWDQAIALADSVFDGLLRYYRGLAHVVPEIAYELEVAGVQGTEIVAVAWPSQKRGVTADLETARRLARLGWHCLTLEEALAAMNGN